MYILCCNRAGSLAEEEQAHYSDFHRCREAEASNVPSPCSGIIGRKTYSFFFSATSIFFLSCSSSRNRAGRSDDHAAHAPCCSAVYGVCDLSRASNAQIKPDGLEWDMPSGLSEICYVRYPPLANDSSNTSSTSSPHVRRGIVEVHNRWSFTKDLPFVPAEDILSMEEDDQGHITVKWVDGISRRTEKTERYGGTVIEHLENDKAAKESSDMETAAAEVWMNGMYIGELAGPSTLQPLLDTVNTQLESKKVCYRRSENLIRIEKYFHGMIRGWEIYEHLLDNLYAMEDAEILDEHTLIGTATLPDWIMGGMLTSRLWLSELPNGNILTQRPLQNDDLRTSDRRYELIKGTDDEKIAIVREELKRLRYLAGLEHPVEKRRQVNDKMMHVNEDDDDDEREPVVEESAVARQARINRRRAKMRM